MSRPTPPAYKTRNWPAYNEALKRRGSLTIWFDPAMTWQASPTGKRGRQPDYSDAAIQTCLTMKVLFGMALRQTTGFVESLLRLIGLDWAVPDFSTLSRRQKTLKVASAATADYFRKLHTDHGVRVLESTKLDHLLGDDRVRAAVLADGREIAADFVLVGVGVEPATALAETAGLKVENGIWTDALGRTSDPSIWAAGDCASFPHSSGRMRLESVGHAIDHAECVAQNMVGTGMTYVAKPWFWSDQYDTKLQIAGLNSGYDQVVERLGQGGSASVWYFGGKRLLAVDAMNDPRAYMVGKRIIEAGQTVQPNLVRDPTTDLRTLAPSAIGSS